MRMKLYYLIICLCLTVLEIQGEESLPAVQKAEDFTIIQTKKPFAPLIKKANALPQKKAPPPISSWVLKGVTKLGNKWYVVIADKKELTKDIILIQSQDREDGLSIVDVKPSESSYRETVVMIKDSNQNTFDIKFDELLTNRLTAAQPKAPPVQTQQTAASEKSTQSLPRPIITSPSLNERRPIIRRVKP